MKASVLDLRRKTKEIMQALDRNEPVTILYRGKERGILIPPLRPCSGTSSAREHPAFGMWRKNPRVRKVRAAVKKMRRRRFNAV